MFRRNVDKVCINKILQLLLNEFEYFCILQDKYFRYCGILRSCNSFSNSMTANLRLRIKV